MILRVADRHADAPAGHVVALRQRVELDGDIHRAFACIKLTAHIRRTPSLYGPSWQMRMSYSFAKGGALEDSMSATAPVGLFRW